MAGPFRGAGGIVPGCKYEARLCQHRDHDESGGLFGVSARRKIKICL